MKHLAWLGTGLVALAMILVGCNWDTGSDADSWSSSFDWVNFSGTYRSADGGIIIVSTDQTTTETTTTTGTGSGSTETNTNRPSTAGTASGSGISRTSAAGTLYPGDIVPMSVGISLYTAGGVLHSSYTDDGAGNLVGGLAPGVIVYQYGSWSIDLSSIMGAPEGGSWKATYRYYTDDGTEETTDEGSESSTTSSTSTSGSGSTTTTTLSQPIYFYTVHHKGQYLTMVDNNGTTFEGQISKMQSASGAQNTDIGQVGADEEANDSSRHAKYTYYESPLPEDGDQVIASFECSGGGSKIVGTLSGVVNLGVLTERWLDGTLITAGSAQGIKATAPAVQLAIEYVTADEAVSSATSSDSNEGTSSTSTSDTTAQ